MNILNYIWPPFCQSCRAWLKARTLLCFECRAQIIPIVSGICVINTTCSIPVVAISDYQEPLKALIVAKKRSHRLAAQYLGSLIWELSSVRALRFDYLVPVPQHWTRRFIRGYNPAQVIARELSRESGKPVADIMRRVKRTRYQLSLTATERAQNVRNAFALALSPKEYALYKGAHLLLVDDLYTTGATARAAVQELLKLEPASITIVVACRVLSS